MMSGILRERVWCFLLYTCQSQNVYLLPLDGNTALDCPNPNTCRRVHHFHPSGGSVYKINQESLSLCRVGPDVASSGFWWKTHGGGLRCHLQQPPHRQSLLPNFENWVKVPLIETLSPSAAAAVRHYRLLAPHTKTTLSSLLKSKLMNRPWARNTRPLWWCCVLCLILVGVSNGCMFFFSSVVVVLGTHYNNLDEFHATTKRTTHCW